jgi:dTDP-4-dehydrorhamnose reductase
MKCLVLGATGMLGRALVAEARRRQIDTVGAGRSGPDVKVDMCDEVALREAVARIGPAVVINSAALVGLAECESRPDVAYAVNARAVALLVELCREHSTRLVQVSTDHYFSDDGRVRHDEHAPIRLVNEYARTKLAGEAFALTRSDSLVIRTNVTGFRGNDRAPTFVEWAITAIEADERMTLFDDFYTSTMAARDFAIALFDLIESRASGLLNVASSQVASKREFVEALAERLGCPLSNPVSGSVWELRPRRAESLGLDVRRAEQRLGRPLPGLLESVETLVSSRPAPV